MTSMVVTVETVESVSNYNVWTGGDLYILTMTVVIMKSKAAVIYNICIYSSGVPLQAMSIILQK